MWLICDAVRVSAMKYKCKCNERIINSKVHGWKRSWRILSATPFTRGNEETYAVHQCDLRFDSGNAKL